METQTDRDKCRIGRPPILELTALEGWKEWKPFLAEPSEPEALIRESLEALAWVNPIRVSIIRHADAPSLAHLPWTALEHHIRSQFSSRLTRIGEHDGHLLRAMITQLYLGALSRSDWDRFAFAPAYITIKAALQENLRLLLFYATVFANNGMDDDLAVLQPTLDLCRRGFLPLGINAERHLYVVTG